MPIGHNNWSKVSYYPINRSNLIIYYFFLISILFHHQVSIHIFLNLFFSTVCFSRCSVELGIYRGGCIICMDYGRYASESYVRLVRLFDPLAQILTLQLYLLDYMGFDMNNGYLFGFSYGGQLATEAGRRIGYRRLKEIDSKSFFSFIFGFFWLLFFPFQFNSIQFVYSSIWIQIRNPFLVSESVGLNKYVAYEVIDIEILTMKSRFSTKCVHDFVVFLFFFFAMRIADCGNNSVNLKMWNVLFDTKGSRLKPIGFFFFVFFFFFHQMHCISSSSDTVNCSLFAVHVFYSLANRYLSIIYCVVCIMWHSYESRIWIMSDGQWGPIRDLPNV